MDITRFIASVVFVAASFFLGKLFSDERWEKRYTNLAESIPDGKFAFLGYLSNKEQEDVEDMLMEYAEKNRAKIVIVKRSTEIVDE